MNLYFLPGLAFDHRIFGKLNLPGYDVNYIDWIEPLDDENFSHYAGRLAEDIDDSGKTVLIGHSLGGIASREIAAVKDIDEIILISSVKSEEEIPVQFKLVEKLDLKKLFTRDLSMKTLALWGKLYDYENEEEQELVKDMLSNMTNTYLQWALEKFLHWKAPDIPGKTKVFHIHGDNDHTLPLRYIKDTDAVIKGGGHFMIYKHPDEISEIIRDELSRL